LIILAHKTEGVNRTKIVRSYPFVFTGEVPCKEVRTPLNSITFSEERNEETCYGYCNEYQPHVVKRMFDYKNEVLYDLRWDDAGNLGQVSMSKPGEMFDAGRFLFWTEDNRMHTAVDDKHYSYYAYDYGGERRLKLVGVNSSVDVNAEYMTAVSTLNEPTLYPSAYMVLTNKGYTKHYYAGTERVAARLGGGGLNALHHVIENDRELQTKADSLFDQCLEQVNSRVLKENDLECIMRNKYAKEEFGHWIEGIPYQMKADVECDHRLFKEMVDSMLTDYHNGEEKEVYFYHSDHLGSASWITDSAGIAVQHLQYLPYGEPYIDQHPFGYSERFTFTGKERDEETGYGYFGARYMDHELMTGWLSVDPMADKYPSISPYAYCAWNPVVLVDPDGKECIADDDPPTRKKKYEIANSNNKHKLSKISWGETSGIYPMKNPEDPNNKKLCYNPTNWDEQKTEELLKARAAIHLIGTQRNSTVHKNDCDINDALIKKLATYHLTSNFPEVDEKILNDKDVKYFFLSPEPKVATPSLASDGQECVMSYGPFYNVGGGDVEAGPIYIHFYKAIKKDDSQKKDKQK